ncbi:MAG: thioredoxin [Firmicutes bacterium HGW-Firmicutes-12]|jgi:thioredoxin 1|nr:MAG: thioredoxin [Firmicutes bacterium HGW-Firmicutes-12]
MANNNVVSLGDDTFKQEVLEATGPILVDFWAPWCGPCKMLGPVVEELAGDYQGKAKICKLNVDESSKTAGEFGVMSIPTMVVFKDGKEVNRLVGFMPKANIAKVLDQIL